MNKSTINDDFLGEFRSMIGERVNSILIEKPKHEPDKFFASVGASVFALPFVALILAGSLWLDSYVITRLWAWFVVPAFSLAPLPLGFACGLLLLIRHIQPIPSRTEKKTTAETFKSLAKHWINALVFLGLGWCVRYAMTKGWL
jgi:hypothetical protein